jgi:hypothetical protein
MTLAPAKHDLRRLEERNGITRLEPCPARWRGQLGLSPDRAIHREAAGLVAENVLARCFGVEEIGGTAGRHHVRTDRASKDGISPSFWTSLVAGGVLVDAGDAEERAGARKPHRRCVYGRRRGRGAFHEFAHPYWRRAWYPGHTPAAGFWLGFGHASTVRDSWSCAVGSRLACAQSDLEISVR